MKALLSLLVIFGKIYIGIKILWWVILKSNQPELHSITEIESYLVLLLLDIWINNQSLEIQRLEKKDI